MGIRVALACSGLGHVRRGHERFTEELARALHVREPGLELRVYGTSVPTSLPGHSIPTLRRSWLERAGKNALAAYRLEQLAFGAALVPDLLGFRPEVVQVSDPALASALFHLRRLLHLDYRILFSNGGQSRPQHYARFDHVHLVGPWQVPAARAFGIPEENLSVIPLGIEVGRFRSDEPPADLRARLDLPAGKLLLSVASLDASVKRLDYVIRSLALTRDRAWNLVCLGQRTVETAALESLARQAAPGRVIFRSAEPDEVGRYLGAADAFVLASASEGFGLALVEAMAAGLPVIVRDLPSLRTIVDDPAQAVALDDQSDLSSALDRLSDPEVRRPLGARNRNRAEAYDWSSLTSRYLEMYGRVRSRGRQAT